VKGERENKAQGKKQKSKEREMVKRKGNGKGEKGRQAIFSTTAQPQILPPPLSQSRKAGSPPDSCCDLPDFVSTKSMRAGARRRGRFAVTFCGGTGGKARRPQILFVAEHGCVGS
jgi:hypothetical protein